MQSIRFSINGASFKTEVDPGTPLLYILRNHFHLNGPKYGCGLGQCGACMILIDNKATLSCMVNLEGIEGKTITTLAGLSAKSGKLHPVQQAFIEEQAAQCGYCTNGMIISAVSLLKDNSSPSEAEIRQALQINLCRCGTQSRVIKAVKKASKI